MYTFDPAVFRILTNSVSSVSLKVDQKWTKISGDLLERFYWSQNHYALYVRFLNLKDYDQESGEIYQCNICDTEACNSWGTDAMPDPQADNSAFSSVPNVFHLLSLTALLLALL